jgi:hypothetical protein
LLRIFLTGRRAGLPQVLSGLQRLVVLGPVEHRAPARGVRVAEADELQAGGEQHGVQRVGEERGHQQRCHRGQDLHADDVQRPLAADQGGIEEVPVAHAEGACARSWRAVYDQPVSVSTVISTSVPELRE